MADAAAPVAAAPPDPALFFEPVAARDAVVTLTLPSNSDAVETEQTRTRGGKRRRSQAAAAARTVEHQVSAHQLQSASPKFRAMLERWSEDGGSGNLRFECASQQEAESWGHLLDCIHTMGRQLPPDLDAIMRLLLLAREQAAEPVVAACLRALHSQVDQLPPTMCLELLAQLETGVSEHEQLQALGDRLLTAACERVTGLLREDAAVRGDAAVQAQLLAFLGPLQHMLNDPQRRELFAKLPFELLRDCIFEDRNVNADAEVTVLAAFACWAEGNLGQLNDEAVERANAILSRVRFPAIPSSALQNYWGQWEFLRRFDPTGDILMRAVVAASEPPQQQMWAAELEAAADNGQGAPGRAGRQFTAAQFKAKCSSWWQPRQPQLAAEDGPAEFAVEVNQQGTRSFSVRKYWRGYWWRIGIVKDAEGYVVVYINPSMSLNGGTFGIDKPDALAYGIQANYGYHVDGSNTSDSMHSTDWFLPGKGYGWGWPMQHRGQTVTWDTFWADGSPWLVNGTACVRFTLKATPA